MDGDGTRIVSYRELDRLWNVGIDAVKARVRRAGWRRTLGDDGTMRVEVPEAVFATAAPPVVATPPAAPSLPMPLSDPLHFPVFQARIAELLAKIEEAKAAVAAVHALVQEAQVGRQAVVSEVIRLRRQTRVLTRVARRA